jgi:hypothetical protein
MYVGSINFMKGYHDEHCIYTQHTSWDARPYELVELFRQLSWQFFGVSLLGTIFAACSFVAQ